MIAQHPGALQLRLYQTLVEVAGEASSTIVFPVPIDLGGGLAQSPAAAGANPAALQAAMQSAVALAATQKGSRAQLGEAEHADSRRPSALDPAVANRAGEGKEEDQRTGSPRR